jgi:hypothetical protein
MGDLELLLVRELPEVASLAIHPVSLENPSARQSLLAVAVGFSIEETSGVLALVFNSLECSMSLNQVILELSFKCITIRESLLAQAMSQALFECPIILAAIFKLEHAAFHLVLVPVTLKNLAIRVVSVVIHLPLTLPRAIVEFPSIEIAFFVRLEVGVNSLSKPALSADVLVD